MMQSPTAASVNPSSTEVWSSFERGRLASNRAGSVISGSDNLWAVVASGLNARHVATSRFRTETEILKFSPRQKIVGPLLKRIVSGVTCDGRTCGSQEDSCNSLHALTCSWVRPNIGWAHQHDWQHGFALPDRITPGRRRDGRRISRAGFEAGKKCCH